MDENELDRLKSLFELLEQFSVESYENNDFKVTFRLAAPHIETALPVKREPEVKSTRSLWEDPTLWPGGVPPKFPGK